MKILIFNWRDLRHSWAGGAEISIFEQASRWLKMGHTITVFCSNDTIKKLETYETSKGIHIIRKGNRFTVYFWAFWYYLTRLRGKVDIVVDCENGIPFFTPLYCWIPKVSFVHHIHKKQFFYELPPILSHIGYIIENFLFPLLYQRVPIIAVSKTTKKDLVRIGFPEKNITIVYNGIRSSKNRKFNAVKKFSTPTILYLGRIKAYKRIDLLLAIFPHIVKRIPNARLIIAGWGTEASGIADLVMKSPFRRKIDLVGPVNENEKRHLLSKSWVFVNPSIGEGWGIGVIEANAYGTPAVAFKVSGLEESIQHGKTGFLARSEKDIIEKIYKILSDKELRINLAKNAREWARRFDWNMSAKKSINILARTAKNNQHTEVGNYIVAKRKSTKRLQSIQAVRA